MAQYTSKIAAMAAIGDHPGWPFLVAALEEAAAGHLEEVYVADTDEKERHATARWRGFRTAIAEITGMVGAAKDQVSVETIDPTLLERPRQHFTARDFARLMDTIDPTDMNRLLSENVTIDLGEEQ